MVDQQSEEPVLPVVPKCSELEKANPSKGLLHLVLLPKQFVSNVN